MGIGFSSRREKSLKTQRPHPHCWDGWEVRGSGGGNTQHMLIFDDEVRRPSPLRKCRSLEGSALHLESSIARSSDCFNILFLLPNPSHNRNYHSTQIPTEFLLFIKCSRAQGHSQA